MSVNINSHQAGAVLVVAEGTYIRHNSPAWAKVEWVVLRLEKVTSMVNRWGLGYLTIDTCDEVDVVTAVGPYSYNYLAGNLRKPLAIFSAAPFAASCLAAMFFQPIILTITA